MPMSEPQAHGVLLSKSEDAEVITADSLESADGEDMTRQPDESGLGNDLMSNRRCR